MIGAKAALDAALSRDWAGLVGAPAMLLNYVGQKPADARVLPKVGDERADEDGWWMVLERYDEEDGPVFVLVDKHGAERVVEGAKVGTGWRTP